jgi:glycosyltransferase involved in cell wall biosynthesis
MTSEHLTLNIVQDLATPHNNSLINALRLQGWERVITWYAMRTFKDLPWKEALAGGGDNYYFDNWPNRWRLVQRFLCHPEEHYLVIGYSNFGSRFILIASWILRRPVMCWMDNPREEQRARVRAMLNGVAYRMLRSVARPMFLVGQHTVEKFVCRLGFLPERVANLPIFIDLPPLTIKDAAQVRAVCAKYQVQPSQMFCVAASRLTYEKGYDLLLEAIGQLDREQCERIRVLILGGGPEEHRLRQQVQRLGLDNVVRFERWLEPSDYERVLAAADVFIHPARFDAFGGGTLYAMALGIPVIGSDGAGAVLERVRNGINGLVYSAGDVNQLTACIKRLSDHPSEREHLGQRARITAEEWQPKVGAEIIENAMRRHYSTYEKNPVAYQ